VRKNFNLKQIMTEHRNFTKKYYDQNNFTDKQKEEMLKTLCLTLHHEVSQIVEATNFKVFSKNEYDVNTNEIVYNAVDSFRYILAILGLYNISHDQFISAYEEKDLYLNYIDNLKDHKKGQPVAIIDIDDIIGEFRSHFNEWLLNKYSILIDKNSTSYYSSKEVKEHGLSPEGVFESFIQENELLNIPSIDVMKEAIEILKSKGCYIQLLTSRPEGNLKCKYQTYSWLNKNNVYYDNLAFSFEKYIWIAKKDFYVEGNVKFAIDDSPKHAMEYATHDIKVLMPDLPYNKNARHENITLFNRENLLNLIKNLI
jgi:hypothetical protein